MNKEIFVFGSNRQGRHGAGAALFAVSKYGAVYGQSSGRQGDSYAIITKELRHNMPPVTLEEVQKGVTAFLKYAMEHPELKFMVTKIGCGLAGFRECDIMPMFESAPLNCKIPLNWNRV